MSVEKPPVTPSEPKPEGAAESALEINEAAPTPETPSRAETTPSEPALTPEQEEAKRAEVRERLAANARPENEAESTSNPESRESAAESAEGSAETPGKKSEKPKDKPKSKKEKAPGSKGGDSDEKEKKDGGSGHKHEAFKPYGVKDWTTATAAVGLMAVGGGLYEGLIAPSIINLVGLGPAVTSSLGAVGLGAGFFGVGCALALYLVWNFGKELWAARNDILKDLPLVKGLGSAKGEGNAKKAAPKKAAASGGDHH